MVLKVEMTDLMSEQSAALSKLAGQAHSVSSQGQADAGLGAAITAELMISFWFGVGVVLAVKMMNSLDYCIEELISRKQGYCQ